MSHKAPCGAILSSDTDGHQPHGKRAFLAGVLAFALTFMVQMHAPILAGPSDEDLARLVADMSTAEKIGQLHQLAGGRSKALNSRLDETMLARVRRGEVGSFLHVAGAKELTDLQRVAVEESPHNIPLLFAMDVVHGYRTIFPVPLAMASSFDPALLETASRIAAEEAASASLHWTFAPMIDIARDPRWGRIVEGAGADPYLGSVMAAAQVRGFQGKDLSAPGTLLATAKHFGAYGAATAGRDYDSADLSERSLHEIYLPPFYAANAAGAGSFMSAFNDINGVPTTSNKALLRDLLKGAWGFDGLIVSDWNAIAELINHGVAASWPDAAARALEAGVDIDMTSGVYADHLGAALRDNRVSGAALDEAVLRILKVKRDLGLFDDPYRGVDAAQEITAPPADHRRIAREVAEKSIVLLKNDNETLPLREAPAQIAVIGALGDDAASQLGSWRARGDAGDVVTYLDAIRARFPDARINYVAASDTPDGKMMSAVRAAARWADMTFLFLGEHYDLSGEARSRSSIELPGAQNEIASLVFDVADSPVIAIISGGRPLSIEAVAARADAVLATWFLGIEAGPALTAVLTGEAAPGGKLPIAFARTSGQNPVNYDHFNRGRPADANPANDTARFIDVPITPLFPFGHGLSYADFRFSDLSITRPQIGDNGAITASFSIENAGAHFAYETPQLYIRDLLASIARPVKQLRGFQRVGLAPGERAAVSFTLTPEQLGFYDPARGWIVEPGEFEIMIGASSADIRLIGNLTIADDQSLSSSAAAPAPAIASVNRVDKSGPKGPPQSIGMIEKKSDALGAIIDEAAVIEQLASGYRWSEGPLWVADDDALYFNDVPNDRMFRWSERDGIRLFLAPSGGARENSVSMRESGANGMALRPGDEDHLVIADHGARALSTIRLSDGRRDIIVDRFEGKRFNSPNDLAFTKAGGIYFTDPPYGLKDLDASPLKEMSVNGVYYRAPDGTVKRIIDDLSFPNGVALSPDERRLYVANSDPERPIVTAYEIGDGGAVSNPQIIYDGASEVGPGRGLPDGMAIARDGTKFLTGPRGVYILSADDTMLGLIDVGTPVSNVALDDQEAYLYLTASHRLARVRLKTGK